MYNTAYHTDDLSAYRFLVTGGGGFIGSHLVEYLLKYGAAKVRVFDNFATGSRANLDPFIDHPAFELMEGDIRDQAACLRAVTDIDFVSHQAALGSVPRSIKDPLTTNDVNITGFLNMLTASKDSGTVKKFVYAASSSTYGDSKELPKVEDRIGKPLSPYAVTKLVNELYADVYARTYGLEAVGLRYFNVFGPRQSPEGVYAAVIPLFIRAVRENRAATVNGDGEQTRDFTYIENVVQANIKALFVHSARPHSVYNVACGDRTSLNELWRLVNAVAGTNLAAIAGPARAGDIRDSLADISKAHNELGYVPRVGISEGIRATFNWFSQQ